MYLLPYSDCVLLGSCSCTEALSLFMPGLTSITVVQVGKLVPLVVLDKAEQRPFDIRPHLDDKLLIPIQREAGCYERDMECPTERRDGVD